MTGAAERALALRFREVIVDLAKIVDDASPIYSTSSGFRSAFDSPVSRDLADISVVAQHVGVLVRSATEQALSEPRPLLSLSAEFVDLDKDDDSGAGLLGNTSLLASPALAAGNERARQAWAALANSWFDEAERLFVEGAKQTPTDAYMWYGAGLAACAIDQSRAADHLLAASRYLLPGDPAGSAYTTIMAASLKEAAGEVSAARSSLLARIQELDMLCPVLSLHLARLGPDRKNRISEALLADPMLEADVVALGFDPTGELAKQRRERTERELALLDYSIAELRRLGDGAASPDEVGNPPAATRPDHGLTEDRLSLVQLEVDLWCKVDLCRQEMKRAETLVQANEIERQKRESELEALIQTADSDLDSQATMPFFVVSMLAATAIIVVYLAAQQMAASAPGVGGLIVSVAWVVQIVLLGWAGHRFVTTWWPHRRFPQAREAKLRVPQFERTVGDLREAEFEHRRRHRQAAQAAELRLQRVLDRRDFLIPARPHFDPSASDLDPHNLA